MKDIWIAPAVIWGAIFAGAGLFWLRGKWRISRLQIGGYYATEPNDPFGGGATVVLQEMQAGWCKYQFWDAQHGLMSSRSSIKTSTFAAIYKRIPTPLEHKP